MSELIDLGKNKIGYGQPVYIIAEISANHNQKFESAVSLLKAAKESGADAVKLQTFTPDTLTFRSDAEPFQIKNGTLWDGRTLYELYEEAHMPWDWQPKLMEIASDIGLDLLSTAFDETAVDFLEQNLDVPAHKLASFEIVDIPLIKKMAGTGKPLMISTGMATLEEIDEAVSAAREAGAKDIVLLKCTSGYPALPEEMNLRAIPHMAEKFNLPIGLSDHSLGTTAAIAAVALGACVVEKHLMLSREIPGPDSAFSMEPVEFKEMAASIRIATKLLGRVHYGPGENEKKSLGFRRSLFVVKDIKAGAVFTKENVRSIRPSYGLHPRYFDDVMGKIALRDISEGTALHISDIYSDGNKDN